MPAYDFRSPRLFVDAPLSAGGTIALERAQSHYLLTVLRRGAGDTVLLFNGRDGEWRGRVEPVGRKAAVLALEAETRPQPAPSDLHYCFAPLKHARLDYMVQKAVEMGAARLQPVLTRHTQSERVNAERMRANAIEAAEQCGILAVPEIAAPLPLDRWLAACEPDRLLVFCDEEAPVRDPLQALAAAATAQRPLAVLIGPEGGFAADERAALSQRSEVIRLSLGPRILRADTAAVAALTLVQAALGDWR